MRFFTRLSLSLYRLGLLAYHGGIKVASLFSDKARLWINGRNHWLELQAQLKKEQLQDGKPLLWMHCASLGEFEQGRPIIEALKSQSSKWQILLTFFSPSGYEIRKNYDSADCICYLPMDSPANARRFLDIWSPQVVIFVKYEYWYYYFKAIHEKGIPLLMAAALFRTDQLFFKWYGRGFRDMLKWVDHFFVQNDDSAHLLQSLNLHHYSISGDPRVDRVLQISERAPNFPLVDVFADGKKVLIIGSSWTEDESVYIPMLNHADWPKSWKVIIAPHQINERKIQKLCEFIKLKTIRYSEASEAQLTDKAVLIIDNIGMLSALYQYGHLAYIGGAFRTGLHNTLEPMAFGLPVFFGPKYHKFEEAKYLVESGGGFSVNNTQELFDRFNQLQLMDNYDKAAERSKAYILTKQGASQQIVKYLHTP
jgi:3-deoxy-D-manno-octulosonic-acid transferase